ncbi:MAG: MFS transporter, partial [Pseudomonadota bacterium]
GGILGEQFGPRAPFYFVACIGAVNLCFGAFVLPETLAPENRRKFEWKRANAFGSFLQFRHYPIMLPIAGVLFLSGLAQWTYPSVWSYYADEKFGWTPGLIGISLMVVGLGAAVVQAGLIRLIIPRLGERRTAIFAMLVSAACYLAFSLAQSAPVVFVLIIISALGGLAQPALQGLMSRTMPANAQGELQGAVGALNSLTMVIGPLLVTQIFAVFSKPGEPFKVGSITVLETGAPYYFPGAPFVFASVLQCLAIVILFRAFRHMRPKADATPASSPGQSTL